MTFIVRASIDAKGLVSGVVLAAQSGRKEQFCGAEQLASVIAAMADRDERSGTGLAQLDRSDP